MEDLNELRATYDHPTDKSEIELIERLEQAEQDRVKLRNRLDAMRRQRDGYRNQLRKAEQQIQRVREVCESDGYEVSNEFGTWDAVAVENIIDALDGEVQ